jgi:lysophospholipase L1-like esterase
MNRRDLILAGIAGGLIGFVCVALAADEDAPAVEDPTVSSAEELAERYEDKITWEQYTAYRAIVDGLPPAQRNWELVLEDQLGAFYFPIHLRNRIKPQFDPVRSEWGFIEDDPALPDVLLIGDSISRSYTVSVRRALEGVANVHRAPANCGNTARGLANMDLWLDQGDGEWDVIYFNFGIHDRNRDPEDYAANLRAIVERLRQTGATLIFARTTPFYNEEAPGVDASEPINAVSDEVMAELGVTVDDLHGAVVDHVSDVQADDRMHFRSEGIALMAEHVAATIREALAGE